MLQIDKEFQSLIPPLTQDEHEQLEANIIKEGCRDALVIWNGIILDGHNRYEICTRNKIPYKTEGAKISNREEAIEWIIKNQFGRRNLSLYERGRLALRLESIWKEKAKENQRVSEGRGQKGSPNSTNLKPIDTRKEIAKVAGLAGSTIGFIKVIENEATPEQKADLLSGKKKVNRVYKEIRPDKPARPISTPYPVEEGHKICPVCGIRKPMEGFYAASAGSICKQCQTFLRKSGNTLETREMLKSLNSHVVDGVDTILESMKTKTPAEAGTLENIYNESITELIDIFNRFNAELNKYLYMGTLLKNQPLPLDLMGKAKESIEAIMNFKED